MPATERNWKSTTKKILNNGYLSFGAGLVVGLFIDNWTLVLVIAAVIWGVQWYTKQKDEDAAEPVS